MRFTDDESGDERSEMNCLTTSAIETTFPDDSQFRTFPMLRYRGQSGLTLSNATSKNSCGIVTGCIGRISKRGYASKAHMHQPRIRTCSLGYRSYKRSVGSCLHCEKLFFYFLVGVARISLTICRAKSILSKSNSYRSLPLSTI